MLGVVILGANGSGKSTIGRELANKLNCAHFDTEDYWFYKSKVPYTVARLQDERNKMLLDDVKKYDFYVVSGDISDWNEVFLKLFSLAVFLEVPANIRVERIQRREYKRFGDRILKGGDMYEQHLNFVEYAAVRDIPLLKKKALKYQCSIVYVDATENCHDIAKKTMERINWPLKWE